MAKLVLFMAMSLDGFIAGPDDAVSQPAGRGGERLFAWSDDGATARAVHHEYDATGAVLSGRRTYDLVNGWGGDHHDGVPMFILTHQPPDEVPEGKGTYTFVTDGVESAVAQAKAAAGDKDVLLHGADITSARHRRPRTCATGSCTPPERGERDGRARRDDCGRVACWSRGSEDLVAAAANSSRTSPSTRRPPPRTVREP